METDQKPSGCGLITLIAIMIFAGYLVWGPEEEQNKQVKLLPTEQLAVIQEGTTPPSRHRVKRFEILINRIQILYPKLSDQEIADKLAKGLELTTEDGSTESFLEFCNGFDSAIQGLLDSGLKQGFDETLSLYICLITNCKL